MGADTIVHVWHAAPGLVSTEEARRSCMDVLDDGERDRMRRFRSAEDAWTYAAAHALLRSALSLLAPVAPQDWRFRSEVGGRPVLDRPDAHRRLQFSLSHTRGRVAVAVADACAVGIDVERAGAGASLLDHPAEFLSRAEVGALERLPAEARGERLLACWTLKEALLKATGLGLSAPLREVSFDLDSGAEVQVALPSNLAGDPAHWRFHRFGTTEGHVVALAIRCGPSAGLRVRVAEAGTLPLRAVP